MSNDPLRLINADALDGLRSLPSESVQCCVTSPPYWGLRDYGVEGQIGLESTFDSFISRLVAIFDEVRRVLKPDGTCWINMGDSYLNRGSGNPGDSGMMKDRRIVRHRVSKHARCIDGVKQKDLIGQPWRLAFALQDAGWWLRRDIIWHKPNPMPETVYDRPSTAHEYIFLLTRSARYFYNRQEAREPVMGNAHTRGDGINKKVAGWMEGPGAHRSADHAREKSGETKFATPRPRQNKSFSQSVNELMSDRNWRSVWTIPTQPFGGSHFATFPEQLAQRCILAGSRYGDTVLDPFGGSGTTGRVALGMGRSAVLIELNPQYCEMIRERCSVTLGLPLEAAAS